MLLILDALALSSLKTTPPVLYLVAMSTVGAVVYGACFLYLPIPIYIHEVATRL